MRWLFLAILALYAFMPTVATAAPGDLDMRYDIRESTKTEMDDREVWVEVFTDGSGWVGFNYREIVNGSLEPVVRQVNYDNRYQIRAGQAERAELVRALVQAGVLDLTNEPYEPSSDYSADLRFRIGAQDKRYHFRTRPTDAPRQAVHAVIMAFAERMKVTPPDDRTGFTRVSEGDRQPAVRVTLRELLADPAKFDGKRVSVVGYFHDEFEGRDLCEPLKSQPTNICIWYDNFSTFADPVDLQQKEAGWQRAEGVFFKGPAGHMGMYGGVITRITRTEPADPVEP